MNTNSERYTRFARRMQAFGLDGLLGALLEAGGPLAPLAGQALYVAQPTLGLFMSRQTITELAEWLDQPDGLADLRHALETTPIEPLDSDDTSDSNRPNKD